MQSTLTKHIDLFGVEYFEPITALTWKIPFGPLMVYDKIETRGWRTEHRGKVLICNGINEYKPHELMSMCSAETIERINKLLKEEETVKLKGYAVFVGVLVDCRPMLPEDEELAFVNYNPRLYSHIYKNVKRITPFKFKGGQKWTNVADQKTLSKIKFQ